MRVSGVLRSGLGYLCRIADCRDAGAAPASFSSWSSWSSGCLAYLRTRTTGRCRLADLVDHPIRTCLGDPDPTPATSDRPPPVLLLAPGSTAFHHHLNTLTSVIRHLPMAGLRLRMASGWRCLFLRRGQAIQMMKARTGPALVRRAAPSFL
jgi:hypothetical protein